MGFIIEDRGVRITQSVLYFYYEHLFLVKRKMLEMPSTQHNAKMFIHSTRQNTKIPKCKFYDKGKK